jgi:hypothetical protein
MEPDAGLIRDIPPPGQLVQRIAAEAEDSVADVAALPRPKGARSGLLRNTMKCET